MPLVRIPEIHVLIGEVVGADGAELVDLECSGSSRKPLLRAYVDVPGGTTAQACAALSRRIEARLEASGLVGERYTLEVSSPGLGRPLRTPRDFRRLLGRAVRVSTGAARGGGRELVGVLAEVGEAEEGGTFWLDLALEGEGGLVRVDGGSITFARAQVPW